MGVVGAKVLANVEKRQEFRWKRGEWCEVAAARLRRGIRNEDISGQEILKGVV